MSKLFAFVMYADYVIIIIANENNNKVRTIREASFMSNDIFTIRFSFLVLFVRCWFFRF